MLYKHYGDMTLTNKVAAFDFDGCLARTSTGHDPAAWSMRFSSVPNVLREYHAAGYSIVIISNEVRGCIVFVFSSFSISLSLVHM